MNFVDLKGNSYEKRVKSYRHKKNILSDVEKILQDNKVEYIYSNDYEMVAKKLTKKKLSKIINPESLDLPEDTIKLFLRVHECKDGINLRQIMK
jgi:hypothetical protein